MDDGSDGAAKGRLPAPAGRGAGINPTNRFETISLEVAPEHAEEIVTESPGGAMIRTQVYRDRSKSIVNPVDSPDIHFNWTLNPYRGCEHGCVYCYARPGHEYLGFSCGVDFETKIVAKFDAPALLREHLRRPAWQGEPIVMSGVTDPYQPVEAALRITRAVLEVMAEFRQPVSIITKNKLVTRDLDLLGELARHEGAWAAVSLTTLDNRLAAKLEPRASAPRDRLAAIAALAGAGVPVTVMTAPIIPGLNDREIPQLLKAAREAGATHAGYVMLRLPHQVKALFLEWLARHCPDRAGKVESLLRQTRDGGLYNANFKTRMTGEGPVAKAVADLFHLFEKQLGFREGRRRGAGWRTPFRRAEGRGDVVGQMGLF